MSNCDHDHDLENDDAELDAACSGRLVSRVGRDKLIAIQFKVVTG